MGPTSFPFVLLLPLLLAAPGAARRPQKRPAPENPIDKIDVQANFDLGQFAGKWFLVGVASQCSYLSENSHRLEATNLVVSVGGASSQGSLLVSTFRPLDGVCWNIQQTYFPTKIPGRFLLKGGRGLGWFCPWGPPSHFSQFPLPLSNNPQLFYYCTCFKHSQLISLEHLQHG
ncbi:Hypothetical predicted protein [Podarcis lilfordi]|uniref:Lipocalin/cytosolic fatty-acid binding domain-containing protein n=1 Tax=Podarcis lilfordi TaxID=74358 RepID=A0AA35L4M9_9SAUR|nr:Hypothetical predicted protein [Podarcis lilfordi]